MKPTASWQLTHTQCHLNTGGVENDKIESVDFIEALACTGGCLGGPLAVENVYVAKTRIKKHVEASKAVQKGSRLPLEPYDESIVWTEEIAYKPVLKLDSDIEKAMKKLETLERINKDLPGLDCGACGAPSCRALAEDIVRGNAYETDCIFKLRERVRDLAAQMKEPRRNRRPPWRLREDFRRDNMKTAEPAAKLRNDRHWRPVSIKK